MDELQRMADEVERKICAQGEPAKEKEEGAESAERPMETEEGPAKTTADPSAGMRLDAPAPAPAE